MRIYENILANLTDSQKLHILTDFEYLSTPACTELGIPSVRVGRMKDYLRAARSRQGPSNDATDGQEHGHSRQ